VVDGHPREFGRYREDLWAKEDEKKRQEESEKKEKEKEKEDDGPIGNEGERRVPSSSDHGFHEWEKQEMEALLGEVRGTLGKSFLGMWFNADCQSCTRRGSWRQRISQTTSCSM